MQKIGYLKPNVLSKKLKVIKRKNRKDDKWQAVWKRITPNMVLFLKALLDKSFKQKCKPFMDSTLFNSFKNVYLQDATHFSLPRFLFSVSPDSYSKYSQTTTAKI